jgi:hypothetical protein
MKTLDIDLLSGIFVRTSTQMDSRHTTLFLYLLNIDLPKVIGRRRGLKDQLGENRSIILSVFLIFFASMGVSFATLEYFIMINQPWIRGLDVKDFDMCSEHFFGMSLRPTKSIQPPSFYTSVVTDSSTEDGHINIMMEFVLCNDCSGISNPILFCNFSLCSDLSSPLITLFSSPLFCLPGAW